MSDDPCQVSRRGVVHGVPICLRGGLSCLRSRSAGAAELFPDFRELFTQLLLAQQGTLDESSDGGRRNADGNVRGGGV